jgi:hypothetical protein
MQIIMGTAIKATPQQMRVHSTSRGSMALHPLSGLPATFLPRDRRCGAAFFALKLAKHRVPRSQFAVCAAAAALAELVVQPVRVIEGHVKLPGSKSLSNRILLLAALAEGTTVVENILVSIIIRFGAIAIIIHFGAIANICLLMGDFVCFNF